MATMRSSRMPRLVRGSLAASIATFVALLSHVSGGGTAPSWIGILVPLVVSVLVCTALAGRSLSLTRLGVAVLGSQALFHLLFVLGTFGPSAKTGTGHAHHHDAAMSMTMETSDMTVVSTAGASMWIAHAVAALITVAALYRGERAVLRLRDVARQMVAWVRRAAAFTIPSFVLVPRRVQAVAVSLPPALLVLFVSVSRRRGPPVARVV